MDNKVLTLKAEYTIAWGVWLALAILGEVMKVTALWYWGFLVLLFGLIEGIAVKRKKPGDTLSETVWVFKRGGWARIPLVLGFVGWASFKLFTLAGATIAAGCLAGGLGLWLLVHFLGDGKHG